MIGTYGGREFAQTHQPKKDRFVLLIIDFTQAVKTEQQMNDEKHHNKMAAEVR